MEPIIEAFETQLIDHISFEETTKLEMDTRLQDIEKLNVSSVNITPIRVRIMMNFILEIINTGNHKAIIYLFEKQLKI